MFGPRCPRCYVSAEWTESEIQDPVFAAKTYCCSECFEMYTVSVEEIEILQKAAQLQQAEFDIIPSETEEDWQRARQEWESPSDSSDFDSGF